MLRRLKDIHIERPLVVDANLSDHKLSDANKKRLHDALASIGYGFDSFTSYAITDKEKEGKPANYAVIPNQYFYYASKMFHFATELYKYCDLYEKVKHVSSRLVGNDEHILKELNNDPKLTSLFESAEDMVLFSKFLDKDNSEFRSGAKRFINDKGDARGARDCFGSIILKEINLPDASSSIFGRLVFDLCAKPSIYEALVQTYTKPIESHAKDDVLISSTTIRDFIRKVFVYLFQNKIENTIFENLEDVITPSGEKFKELILNDKRIYRLFRESDTELEESDLTSGTNIRYFPDPFTKYETFLYLTNQWADTTEDSLVSRDIGAFALIFNSLYTDLKIQKKDSVYQLIKTNRDTRLTLSKPFILLAGISGTGKSRFVRQQAAAQGSEKEFLQMVPVRPDWHEPSDLLGYVSRIGGADRLIVTDALRFMVKAWKAAGAEAVTLPDGRTGWTGKRLDSINTYWLCLDEMNLAPVEQYFADYLSVIESRSWLHDDAAEGHDYIYCCDPILPAAQLKVASDNKSLAEELGLDIVNSSADKQLWDAFLQHGIPVPFNLVVAGTVNMDETTHGFSRKVIDRALTFDFGRFFPNDFANLWAGQPTPKVLSFAKYSHARAELLTGCKANNNGQNTIGFLQAVNDVLKDTPFELAYRALNELLLAVICHNPADDIALQAVWDDFMMCKVLPRIEGDDEKLAVSSDSDNNGNLLNKLEQVLETQLATIWQTGRPELLIETAALAPCRCKAKLAWMNERLTRNSFTSFWP